MALKAGRVGVNPNYVDSEGKPIGSGGSSDAYTKAQADAKFATKTALAEKADASSVYTKTAADDKFALQTDLTANSNKFVFAYSNGQYGYKAGTSGAFNPFEKAGVTYMGWVKPATLSHENLAYGTGVTYVSGGYASDDLYVYVDIVLAVEAQIGVGGTILTMPDTLLASTAAALAGNSASASNYVEQYALSVLQSKNIAAYPAAQPATQNLHIWGQYAKA